MRTRWLLLGLLWLFVASLTVGCGGADATPAATPTMKPGRVPPMPDAKAKGDPKAK